MTTDKDTLGPAEHIIQGLRPWLQHRRLTSEGKTCSRCKKFRAVHEFRWKNKTKGLRISMCRDCDRECRAVRYEKQKKQILEANRRSTQRKRELVATKGVSEGKRRCIDCLEFKPVKQFRWKNKAEDRRVARCVGCDRAWRASYYDDHKHLFLASNKRQYKKIRRLVEKKKTGVPCADCGRIFPSYAMDFDHGNGFSKIDKVSALVYRGSERLVLEEIAKCDVVCAVCHRIRTFGDK